MPREGKMPSIKENKVEDDSNFVEVVSEAIYKASQKNVRESLEKKKPERVNYFQESKWSTCETIEDLKCPAVNDTILTGNVRTRIDYINPIAGEIKCSLFPITTEADTGMSMGNDMIQPAIVTKTFKQTACSELLSDSSNIDTSEEIETLRELFKTRGASLKEQEFKYTIDYKKSGGETFLDLADWLDALATLDGEKIDIDKTLSQWEVHTTDGYTIKPNELILDSFAGDVKALQNYYSGGIARSADIENDIATKIRLNETNAAISNSQFVMYLDFFTRSSTTINDAVQTVLLLFVLWNMLGNWLFHYGTQVAQGQGSNENHIARLIFGVGIFLVFFAGGVDEITIEKANAEAGGSDTITVEVKQQRIQEFIRMGYSFTNDLSDKLAYNAITSYLHTLTVTSGIMGLETINSLSSERMALQKENLLLNTIDKEMCIQTYDLEQLTSKLKAYRNKTLSNKTAGAQNAGLKLGNWQVWDNYRDDYSSIDINPYPYTEREANVLMGTSANRGPYSYYNTAVYSDGFIKNGYFERNGDKNFLSLSGCSYNKKKMISNVNRLAALDVKLTKLEDDDAYNKKVEQLRVIHNTMWRAYGELGYISMAFLPATSIMIDNMGDLGDKKERDAKLATASEDTNGGFTKAIVTGLPMMAVFGGHQIAETVNNLIYASTEMISSLVGTVSDFIPVAKVAKTVMNVGDKLGDDKQKGPGAPGLFSYYIAYELINSMLNTMVFVVLITGSILAFIMLTLQKLWVFFASMFLVIHTFGPNQEEKITAAVGKMIAVAFKSVLLTSSIFIAIWSIDLLNSLEHILTTRFFDSMGQIFDASKAETDFSLEYIRSLMANTLQKYSYYGISHLVFQIVKIILSVTIIFKLPGYFFELIDTRVQDMVQPKCS